MYKKATLDNGLSVITIEMPHMQSVSLGIWIATGGRYENERIAGISHFIEHLLFKGTEARSARDLKVEIESKGGSVNAFTGEECTCFFAKMPKEHWRAALEVLSDMVISARLDEKDIENERLVILEEIKMYLDLPTHHVHELLNALLWPGQPLGMNLSGTPESVKSISATGIREHKKRHYISSKIAVIAAGALEHNRLRDRTASIFAQPKAPPPAAFERADDEQEKPRRNIESKKTKQTHISLGFHGLPKGHPDIYALSLLNVIMGGNMSSRLYHEIREESALAYEINSYLRKMSDTGAFVVSAGVDNKKVVRAIELILKQLSRVKREGVTDTELANAKDFYLGQFELALEETMDRMLWVGDNFITLGSIPEIGDIFDKVRKIGKDDVSRVAEGIIQSGHLNLASIGPIAKKEEKKIAELLVV